MGAFQNVIGKLSEGWASASSKKKLGIIVLISGIITALILFIVLMGKPKYEPLYYNMSPEDMANVVNKLKQDKVSYKLEGDTVLVPKDMVEELRLNVISSGILPSDGKGFELFDESRFGMTDTETQILYQRALETEIQRTILGTFEEIENVRVHLVLPEPSVFVTNDEPAKASVTLKMKRSKTLTPDQAKTLVALVSGSVKNLPKENVEVVDNNYNYLSESTNDNSNDSPSTINDRQQIVNQFEIKISDDLKKMLEAVFGPNKVKVAVNADLDFDSKQVSSIKYDPEQIVKNQNTIKETVSETTTDVSGSPIDDNMSNTTPEANGTVTSNREETTTNYNVGQVEETTIKAPGQVRRLSTSVIIDGTLSDAVKSSVTNIVMAATGYVNDDTRKDIITVEGMPFDDTAQKRVEEDLKQMEALQEAEEKKQRLIMYIGYPAAAVIGLILLIIIISRLRAHAGKSKEKEGIDVVINEPVAVNEIIKQQAILDTEDTRPDLADEIKKYASKKPEQIVEIVKSWLAEDER